MTSGLIPVVLIVSDFSSLLLWLLEKRAIRIKDTQWEVKAVAGLGCPQGYASQRDICCDDLPQIPTQLLNTISASAQMDLDQVFLPNCPQPA
jgi:hypothetical protein